MQSNITAIALKIDAPPNVSPPLSILSLPLDIFRNAIVPNLDKASWIALSCASWFFRQIKPQVGIAKRICFYAASAGHLGLLEWGLRKNPSEREEVCTGAVYGNQIELLRWAWERDFPRPLGICTIAATQGSLQALQFLREKGCPWHVLGAVFAAQNGHFETLKWALENQCPVDAQVCGLSLNLKILQLARANACPWTEQLPINLIMTKRWSMLQWAVANGVPCGENLTRYISKMSDSKIIEQILACGIPINSMIGQETFTKGNQVLLEYGIRLGFPLKPSMILLAAGGGQLTMLKFLRSHEVPYDSDTCAIALVAGHSDIFRWAHQDGAPINWMTVVAAFGNQDFDTVRFLLKNGASWAQEIKKEITDYLDSQKLDLDLSWDPLYEIPDTEIDFALIGKINTLKIGD